MASEDGIGWGALDFGADRTPDSLTAQDLAQGVNVAIETARASIGQVEALTAEAIAACAEECGAVLGNCVDCIQGQIQRHIDQGESWVNKVTERIGQAIQVAAGEAQGRLAVAQEALGGIFHDPEINPEDNTGLPPGRYGLAEQEAPAVLVNPTLAGDAYRLELERLNSLQLSDAGVIPDNLPFTSPSAVQVNAQAAGLKSLLSIPTQLQTGLEDRIGFGIETGGQVEDGPGPATAGTTAPPTETPNPNDALCADLAARGIYPSFCPPPPPAPDTPPGDQGGNEPPRCEADDYVPPDQKCWIEVPINPNPNVGGQSCFDPSVLLGPYGSGLIDTPDPADPNTFGLVGTDPGFGDPGLYGQGPAGFGSTAGAFNASSGSTGTTTTAGGTAGGSGASQGTMKVWNTLQTVPGPGGPSTLAIGIGNLQGGPAGGVGDFGQAGQEGLPLGDVGAVAQCNEPNNIRVADIVAAAFPNWDYCNPDDWESAKNSTTNLPLNMPDPCASIMSAAKDAGATVFTLTTGGSSILGYLQSATTFFFQTLTTAILAIPCLVIGVANRIIPIPKNCNRAGSKPWLLWRAVVQFLGGFLQVLPKQVMDGVIYSSNFYCQSQIPSAEALTSARAAGRITEDIWEYGLKLNGVCVDWYRPILDSGLTQPSYQAIFGLKLAELIGEEEEATLLGWVGVRTDQQKDVLRKTSEAIPGPADLLRMMVRDVEDPQAIQDGKLDDDFDTKFQGVLKQWSQRQNVPEDVFKYYWRAHWQLPSPGQLYEMLHRLRPDAGVKDSQGNPLTVDTPDVLRALKTDDYAPGWVEKLTAISYRPLGIRQIARAYETDTINSVDARKRYQDLGYTKDDAQILSSYLQVDSAERRAGFLGGFSPKAARAAYLAAEITEIQFRQVLTSAGFPESNVEERIDSAKMAIEIADRKAAMKAARKDFLSWGLDTQQYLARLTALGVEADRAQGIVARDSLSRATKVKAIALAKLCELVKKGYLKIDEYVTRAVNMGYGAIDATMLAGACMDDIEEALKKKVTAEIRQAQAQADKATARAEKFQRQQAKEARAKYPCKGRPKPVCPPGYPDPPV